MGYKVGDKITVTFTGTVRELDSHNACVKLTDDTNIGFAHYVYLDSSGVQITRVDPANWPPQVGDIWEADGTEYYARVSRRDSRKLFIGSFSEECDYLGSELDKFKALNPRLIRRRDS